MRLVTERLGDGDVLMGIEQGVGWHFHPTEAEAFRILDAVQADQVVIMGTILDGQVRYQLMDDLELDVGPGADGIVYAFRLWSGPVTFENLADGRVSYVPLAELWDWRA
jgi:hypothetical protein